MIWSMCFLLTDHSSDEALRCLDPVSAIARLGSSLPVHIVLKMMSETKNVALVKVVKGGA